jgi:hypothetical protein
MNTRKRLAHRWLAALAVTLGITGALLVGSSMAAATASVQDRAAPASAAPSELTVHRITLGSGPLRLDAFETAPLPGFWAFTGVSEENNSQRWVFVPQDDGYYSIHQLSTGRSLDTGYLNYVTTTLFAGKPSQQWRVHDLGGGFATFEQKGSGLYLQSTATATSNFVFAMPWNGTSAQVWRLV